MKSKMRILFIALVILSCTNKLQTKKITFSKNLSAHDSVYLYQAKNDVQDVERNKNKGLKQIHK